MYKKQCRLLAKKEGRIDDLEAGPKEEQDSSKEATVEVTRADESRDGSEIELTEHSIP